MSSSNAPPRLELQSIYFYFRTLSFLSGTTATESLSARGFQPLNFSVIHFNSLYGESWLVSFFIQITQMFTGILPGCWIESWWTKVSQTTIFSPHCWRISFYSCGSFGRTETAILAAFAARNERCLFPIIRRASQHLCKNFTLSCYTILPAKHANNF